MRLKYPIDRGVEGLALILALEIRALLLALDQVYDSQKERVRLSRKGQRKRKGQAFIS
jgi:hypothetical protein